MKINRTQVLRILFGLFMAYTFACFFNSAQLLQIIRDFSKQNLWNEFFHFSALHRVDLVAKILSGIGFAAAILFVFKKCVRAMGALMIILLILVYNLDICIVQPHLSYLIFSLVMICLSDSPGDSVNESHARILQIIYGLQMMISGLSKMTMPEWRNGLVFNLMSRIYDPEPGIYLMNMIPESFQLGMAWFVLCIECASIIYLIKIRARFWIWILHLFMYLGIILMVPHAKHVAYIMILFNLLIIDSSMWPKAVLNTNKM